MCHSMFSADKEYETTQNIEIRFNVSIEGSKLNLMQQCISVDNNSCTTNNGYRTEYLNNGVQEFKRPDNISRVIRAYVIFLCQDSLSSDCSLYEVEDFLLVNLRNGVILPPLSALLNYNHSKADFSEIDSKSLSKKQFNHFITYQTSTQLAGCISKSMKMSNKFSRSFLNFVRNSQPDKFQNNLVNRDPVPLIISMTRTNVSLNHSWDRKMSVLVVKEGILDDAMNWLSTLGGAYSALGDHDNQFADLAGSTSMEQLKIALHLASPPLIIRCKLFYSISLTQRKQFKMAKKIIRTQYEAAKALPIEDKVLLNMCHGIWNKLRYLWTISMTTGSAPVHASRLSNQQ